MTKQLMLFLFFLSSFLNAQIPEEATSMRVVRCSAVDQNASIRNIHVDENDVKWIASNRGIFKLFSADNAAKEIAPPKSWSLLQFRDGNELRYFPKDKMTAFLQKQGEERNELDRVTTAFIGKRGKQLWVGTSHSGVYQFSVGTEVQLINHFTTENSKLKSNFINTILIDRYGRQWIGTKSGVLYGNEGKWKLYEKRDNIIAITSLGKDVWILGNDVLFQVDEKNRWLPGDVDSRLSQGEIRDIEYDSEGRLWVASDIIVRYDVVKDKVEKFTKANGFTSKEINVISVDKEDALWVGTADKGLFLIEKETKMTVTCAIEKGLSCEGNKNDASLIVKVIGGTEPFQYNWNIDQNTKNPSNLGPGVYEVTVTDFDGKQRVAKAKIDQVKLLAQINIEEKASAGGKANGRASIEVTGGVPDYKYRWDNGETSFLATNLSAGKHSATITDKMGCKTTVAIEIPAEPEPVEEPVEEPIEEPVVEEVVASVGEATKVEETIAEEKSPEPVPAKEPEEKIEALEVAIKDVFQLKCADAVLDKIPFEISGGKKPYDILWSNASLEGKKIKAGSYSVIVTDALQTKIRKTFVVKAPEAIKVTLKQEQAVSKEGQRDGIALASANGGTGKYLWLWDNGESKARAKRLSFGKHSISVTDVNGCEAVAQITIDEKAVPELKVTALRSGQTIRLKKLYFQSDSTNIEAPSIPSLNEVFTFLKENPTVVVEVGGHTNNIPPPKFCDNLSTARAKAVADYLVIKGIEAERVVYKGYGKRKPIASNKTKEGRKKNQRVELKILSLGD